MKQSDSGSVLVLFPGAPPPGVKEEHNVKCDVSSLSRDPPPPLPGGYVVGEQVFINSESHTLANGFHVNAGKCGEVVGPSSAPLQQWKGMAKFFLGEGRTTGVALRFAGRSGAVTYVPRYLSRHPPLSLARSVSSLFQKKSEVYVRGDLVYYTGLRIIFESGVRIDHGTWGEVFACASGFKGDTFVDVLLPGCTDLFPIVPTEIGRASCRERV